MTNTKTIPAVEARIHLGEIMKRAFKNGERFIVEKSGLPMVAIVNANEYFRMVEGREERFRVVERIKARLPDRSPEQVERDVQEAIRVVRKRRA